MLRRPSSQTRKQTWWLLFVACTHAGCADVLGMELSTRHAAHPSGGAKGEAAAGGATASGGTTAEISSSSSSRGGAKSSTEGIKIAWMSNGTTSTFFSASQNGAMLAGQQLSQVLYSAIGKTVDVSIMSPANNLAATQVERIRKAVEDQMDAIAIDVIDPAVVGPEIDAAVSQGVTVMTFDSDAPGSKRISYYGMDNRASGVVAAKMLTGLMGPGGGKIAVMHKENPPAAANFVARREGFMSELGNHPGFEVVVELPCTDGANGEATLQKGCTGVLEQAMIDYPSVTGWFLSRGRVLRETELAEKAPNFTKRVKEGKFFAVSYDATVEAVPNIRAGFVNAVISQKYWGWGYEVVNLLYDIVRNGRSVNPFTDSGFDVVCASNVEEVDAAWQASNFSKSISKCSLAGQQWP